MDTGKLNSSSNKREVLWRVKTWTGDEFDIPILELHSSFDGRPSEINAKPWIEREMTKRGLAGKIKEVKYKGFVPTEDEQAKIELAEEEKRKNETGTFDFGDGPSSLNRS